MRHALAASALTAVLATAGLAPAAAQQDSPFDVSADVAAFSDYIDRGVSLSGEDPTIQGSFLVEHRAGFYVSGFASLVDDVNDNDVELEGVFGYGFNAGAYEVDVSASFTSLVGGDALGYFEVTGVVSRDFGLAYLSGGLSYAPDGRWFQQGRDTVYGYVQADVPIPTLPWLTLLSHVGYEVVDSGIDSADWGLGLAVTWRDLELSVGYEDSDLDNSLSNARAVVGLRYYF